MRAFTHINEVHFDRTNKLYEIIPMIDVSASTVSTFFNYWITKFELLPMLSLIKEQFESRLMQEIAVLFGFHRLCIAIMYRTQNWLDALPIVLCNGMYHLGVFGNVISNR